MYGGYHVKTTDSIKLHTLNFNNKSSQYSSSCLFLKMAL